MAMRKTNCAGCRHQIIFGRFLDPLFTLTLALAMKEVVTVSNKKNLARGLVFAIFIARCNLDIRIFLN
ncbi:Hypothetical predicted protein [Cloeon dipterum]|uniref:Uncharacterized protein n=1 Tax=Cloeon dipterum TaxID=197152 RepID=A0A8S1CHZ5_9INSE|nr:Hypothetical predicted protein [Cloeon dipterum]